MLSSFVFRTLFVAALFPISIAHAQAKVCSSKLFVVSGSASNQSVAMTPPTPSETTDLTAEIIKFASKTQNGRQYFLGEIKDSFGRPLATNGSITETMDGGVDGYGSGYDIYQITNCTWSPHLPSLCRVECAIVLYDAGYGIE